MSVSENKFKQEIWHYYLMLESDFMSTRNFVQIDEKNYPAFGLRYLNVIEACCWEIDTLLRVFYKEYIGKASKKDTSINKLRFYAQNNLYIGDIGDDNSKILLKGYKIFTVFNNIELQPWSNYVVSENIDINGKKYFNSNNTTPKWRKNYNDIKHNRISVSGEGENKNFEKANLENALNALSGLYLVLPSFISYFRFETVLSSLDNKSKLFDENCCATKSEIEEALGIKF